MRATRERLPEKWAGRRDGTWDAPPELCRLLRLPRLGILAQGCCSELPAGVPCTAVFDGSGPAAESPAAAAAPIDAGGAAPGVAPSLAMVNSSGWRRRL